MTHLTQIILVAALGVSLTNCADLAVDHTDHPVDHGDMSGGKGDLIASTDGYFLFHNGTECFTAPCDSFTAVDQYGQSHPIADLVALPLWAMQALANGGLDVTGSIVYGSWNLGEDGDVMVVDEVLLEDPTKRYGVFDNGTTCILDPCPNWSAATGDSLDYVASVDLSQLGLSAQVTAERLLEMADGKWLVKGWIVPGSWNPGGPGDVLVVELLHR